MRLQSSDINRIRKKFIELAKKKKTALIPFITAGDPSLTQTEKLILELEKSGADIIELGIPFSDPLADGPVIQQSYQRALKNNVSIGQVLALVKKIRKKSQIPLLFMAAYNLVFQYGESKFVREAEKAGLDGLLVPDLPLEEAKPLWEILRGSLVDMIFLLAPTSELHRIQMISKLASGFVYYISRTGITGERKNLSEDIQKNLEGIRDQIKIPVAVGFGISKAKQVRQVSNIADGVVVGSALVRLIAEAKNSKLALKQAGTFIRKLKKETN